MLNEPLKSKVAIYPTSSSPKSCPDSYELVFKQYRNPFIQNFGKRNISNNYFVRIFFIWTIRGIFVQLINNKMKFSNDERKESCNDIKRKKI